MNHHLNLEIMPQILLRICESLTMPLAASSLQPWFSYVNAIWEHGSRPFIHLNLTDIATASPLKLGCLRAGSSVACAEVCRDSRQLFNPAYPNNLVTCGSWASIRSWMSYKFDYHHTGSFAGPIPSEYDTLLAPFEAAGFLQIMNGSGDNLLAGLMQRISACTSDCYRSSHAVTDVQSIPYSCSVTGMFQRAAQVGHRSLAKNNYLEDCFMELCRPRTLNPDLGGIGVSCSVRCSKVIALRIRLSGFRSADIAKQHLFDPRGLALLADP